MTITMNPKKPKTRKSPKLFPDELIDQLLAQVEHNDAESILGESGTTRLRPGAIYRAAHRDYRGGGWCHCQPRGVFCLACVLVARHRRSGGMACGGAGCGWAAGTLSFSSRVIPVILVSGAMGMVWRLLM